MTSLSFLLVMYLLSLVLSTTDRDSYLYLVGLEGCGHHGVTEFIKVIGKACGESLYLDVTYEHPYTLRKATLHRREKQFVTFVNGVREKQNTSMSLIDWRSFPFEGYRPDTPVAIKSVGLYDLDWIGRTAKKSGLKAKFLYLNRNTVDMVDSHQFDKTFEQKIRLLHAMLEHIQNEAKIFTVSYPNSCHWAQTSFERFLGDPADVAKVVTSIINFFEWGRGDGVTLGESGCNISSAVEGIIARRRVPKLHTLSAAEKQFLDQFDWTINVPIL